MPKLTNENLKEFLEEIWAISPIFKHYDEFEEEELLKKAKKILEEWGIEIGE